MLGTVFAFAVAAAAPHPGELKTFGDWTVGCDNGRVCEAVALVPDRLCGMAYICDHQAPGAQTPGVNFLTMAVARQTEPSARVTVYIRLDETKPAYAEAAGKRIRIEPARDGAVRIASTDVPTLIAAARTAPALTLRDAKGKTVGSVSLEGAIAALLYIDDQQKRIGTVTALVRPGPKPASAVPPPLPLPVIAQPPVSAKPPRTISVEKATALIGPDNARCNYAHGKVEPEAHRLDAGHTLVLVSHPCGNGAYNFYSSTYVVDESGRIASAHFDADPGMGEGKPRRTDWTRDAVNAGWNDKRRGIDTFARGRSLGDCGVAKSFAWDGARFRLVEQSAMGECRGSTDYITTWRAAVR